MCVCVCGCVWLCVSAFLCGVLARSSRNGFVAVVAGSSGKVQYKGNLQHPAHRVFNAANNTRGLFEAGSLVVDIDSAQGTLRGRFLTQHGAVADEFWIEKGDGRVQRGLAHDVSAP
jgi:hypothetical protein